MQGMLRCCEVSGKLKLHAENTMRMIVALKVIADTRRSDKANVGWLKLDGFDLLVEGPTRASTTCSPRKKGASPCAVVDVLLYSRSLSFSIEVLKRRIS